MTNIRNLPPLLLAYGRFCVWKYETRPDQDKPTKIPYNPKEPETRARVNDLSTFAPALIAESAAKQGFDGMGVAVTGELAGIDIDHCITGGELSPMALDIVKTMDAYTEISPSGEGIRILFAAPGFSYDKDKYYTKNSGSGLEVYIAGMTSRFLTVTGNVLDGHKVDLIDRADRLQGILDKYMKRPGQTTTQRAAAPIAVSMDDSDLIEKAMAARNGAQFAALWSGDFKGYPSQSEADQALCNTLAFWTGCDKARMDRLFRQSGLMRDKWDKRRDYREHTLQRAVDGCRETYTPTQPRITSPAPSAPPAAPAQRGTGGPDQSAQATAAAPDQGGKAPGRKTKPRLTMAALSSEMAMMGYFARFNVITKEYEFLGKTAAGRALSMDDLIVLAHDALTDSYTGASFDTLTQYVNFMAREQQHNPVLEVLSVTKWDGQDRLPQVYALLGIEEDELSKVLVRKWLWQTVALLFNDMDNPFEADGCLVLKGEQGAGKTSFFAHLAMQSTWFGEGMVIDDRDKDTTRRVLSVWIAELGEVESTMKSDIAALKAFISKKVDHYRLPYGKSDVVAPRMTSLCATCNSDRYLIDTTGNRRWWSVPLQRYIPRAELLQLDALQLWAQVYASVAPMTYKEKAACFRLTGEERDDLNIRNGDYEKPTKGQDEVADILTQAERDHLPTRLMTVTEFKELWPALKSYAANQLSVALKRCGVTPTHTKRGSVAMLPLPFHTTRA